MPAHWFLYEAVPVFAESDEGDRELLVDCVVWPIADADGQVAVMVQFVDADGDSVFKLTSSLNERFGDQLLRPGVSLVVHGDSVELETDVESAVVRNRSMHQDETGLMEAIIVADIVEKNVPSSSEVLVGSPYPRTYSQPQIGIVRVKQFGSLYGWAACVSSIGEYMTGVKRADIAISQQVLGSGTSANAGAMEVSAGLRLYYYPSSNTVLNGKAMTGSIGDTEIKRWIDGGLPVYAVFGNPPLLTGYWTGACCYRWLCIRFSRQDVLGWNGSGYGAVCELLEGSWRYIRYGGRQNVDSGKDMLDWVAKALGRVKVGLDARRRHAREGLVQSKW